MATCTVYNAAGDRIGGYIHRMSGKLPAMVEAIAKFGNSAYWYFRK